MRADYDSKADSLQITLVDVEHYPPGVYGEDVGQCIVNVDDAGTVYDLHLLGLDFIPDLVEAAIRYGLDPEAVDAAARAAIAAPDRVVTLDVAEKVSA